MMRPVVAPRKRPPWSAITKLTRRVAVAGDCWCGRARSRLARWR